MMLSNPLLKPCLIVLTSQKDTPGTETTAEKYMKLSQLIKFRRTLNLFNIESKIATISGSKITFSPERDEATRDWLRDNQFEINNPLTLEKLNASDFSAIFFPNLYSFHSEFKEASRSPVKDVIKGFADSNKIIACIGYGLVPLIKVSDEAEKWIFQGKSMTSVSIFEDLQYTTLKDVPFIVEEKIRDLGANFSSSKDGSSSTFIIIDGNLITGQSDSSFDLLVRTFCLSLVKDAF